uniref:Uncharacterized protein n=1 Tax=Rhizophora mucronata TaxID=61149 RepID=A0A2P2INU7_RHIMU
MNSHEAIAVSMMSCLQLHSLSHSYHLLLDRSTTKSTSRIGQSSQEFHQTIGYRRVLTHSEMTGFRDNPAMDQSDCTVTWRDLLIAQNLPILQEKTTQCSG